MLFVFSREELITSELLQTPLSNYQPHCINAMLASPATSSDILEWIGPVEVGVPSRGQRCDVSTCTSGWFRRVPS